MPRSRRKIARTPHPLIAVIRRQLGEDLGDRSRAYLALLDDRLAALAALGQGRALVAGDLRLSPADRALARRFLAAHEGAWDDGDENLVRGFLDRWLREGDDPFAATARGLSEAASSLARMEARPETLWFFLWELESVLSGIADN